MLQLDHANTALGLVVVPKDLEVGREAQDVVLVIVQALEQGPGWALRGPPRLPVGGGNGFSASPTRTRSTHTCYRKPRLNKTDRCG